MTSILKVPDYILLANPIVTLCWLSKKYLLYLHVYNIYIIQNIEYRLTY